MHAWTVPAPRSSWANFWRDMRPSPAELPSRSGFPRASLLPCAGAASSPFQRNLEPVSLGRILWATVAEIVKFGIRRIAPLAAPPSTEPVAGRNGADPPILSHEFDLVETAALQALALAQSAKLNDILLRDLFQVVAQWNTQGGALRPSHWLLINMPKNMREPADDAMPVANRMSYAFLTRRSREVADPAGLLDYVRNETELVRKYGLGLFFLGNIAFVQSVPGLLNWLLSGERCFATTILSNFGNVTRQMGFDFPAEDGRLVIGNVRLERWQVAAPVRHLTRAIVCRIDLRGAAQYLSALATRTATIRAMPHWGAARELCRADQEIHRRRRVIGQSGRKVEPEHSPSPLRDRGRDILPRPHYQGMIQFRSWAGTGTARLHGMALSSARQ